MPHIGEIEKGRYHKFTWLKCPICRQERWISNVTLYRQRKYGLPIGRCLSCVMSLKGKESRRWSGGITYNNGYIMVYKPEHPKVRRGNYVFLHILVWEQSNGKQLPDGWLVHHLNGIKADNRPENLEAMPKNGHSPALTVKEVQGRLRVVEAELSEIQKRLDKPLG